MVKKSFFKTFYRTIFRNKTRFLTNFFITLLAIGITSGLGAIPSTYKESFSTNYSYNNAPDINLKARTAEGITQEQIDYIKSSENFAEVTSFTTMDVVQETKISRLYIVDFNSFSIGKLHLLEGSYPTDISKVVVETGNLNLNYYNINDSVNISNLKSLSPSIPLDRVSFKVSGIVKNSMYNSILKELAHLEDESQRDKFINEIIYIDVNHIKTLMPSFAIASDLYIRYNINHHYLSDHYNSVTRDIANKIETDLGKDKVKALTLLDTTSYSLFTVYCDKIDKLSYIFPIFFIAVCALVNSIIITRLIKDERSQIGCYHSLGISKSTIVAKYLLFSLTGVALGSIAGYLIGTPVIPLIVFKTFCAVYYMGPNLVSFFSLVGFVVVGIIIAAAAAVTLFFALKNLRQTPALLFRPISPKSGKKILLEKIPQIWNRLSFSYKSSFRNIFRQKKNFFLTSLSIIGSNLLVLLGFTLLDVSNELKHDSTYGNVAQTMGGISAVIIIFAITMAITIIYTLASMNITDRVRELATLKVLGYHERECSNYTFREILIISIIATILSIPISVAIIAFVLEYLKFGNICHVKWYSYLASIALIITSTLIVNFLLRRKIRSIDMNGSLKSIE